MGRARKSKIIFDMDDLSDISDDIIVVNKDFYTKRTTARAGSLRFAIPMPIKAELELNVSDLCYFCQYSEGFYISFKHKPEAATKAQVRSRKLAAAGDYGTLYVCIPQFIKNLHREPITSVQLIRTEGFEPHEWQIKFLSIDCT